MNYTLLATDRRRNVSRNGQDMKRPRIPFRGGYLSGIINAKRILDKACD